VKRQKNAVEDDWKYITYLVRHTSHTSPLLKDFSLIVCTKRVSSNHEQREVYTQKPTIRYIVFDAPSYDGNYEERVNWLRKSIPVEKQNCYAAVVGIKKCQGKDHLLKQLQEIIDVGKPLL